MNQEGRAALDRRAHAWLGDGPDAAPAGLLAATVARTRTTPQRRGWVAQALGTPGMTAGAARFIEARLLLAVLALLLAALAAIAAFSVGNQRPLTVLASLSPTAALPTRPSPRESVEPSPPHATEPPSATEPPPSSPPPAPVTLHRLRLAMPAGWIVSAGSIRIDVTSSASGIFRIKQEVESVAPGGQVWIPRPVSVGTDTNVNAGFWVKGRTFGELVAALDAGLQDATRSTTRIDGGKGYRWAVPQRTVIEPLVDVAAIEWRGRFYVLYEQLPLDGDPGTTFEQLLRAVSLL